MIHAIFTQQSVLEQKKEHKRMCFTVIIATMVIQKEQCAAEYHWQLRVPAITAKNALDGIKFFLVFSR